MTVSAAGTATKREISGRAARALARKSRRPSRLGSDAGVVPGPDRERETDAGFPGLLARTWQRALETDDLRAALEVLLTLDGYVPADVQLRALRRRDEVALHVLSGLSWRSDRDARPSGAVPPARPGTGDTADESCAYLGEVGLTVSGRIVLRTPGHGPLTGEVELVGGIIRVPWSAEQLSAFEWEIEQAEAAAERAVADCRRWLALAGPAWCDELLDVLIEASLRTAPFVLYQDGRQYTNFRDLNTLTGKTLWPGHPDCLLSSLRGMPLRLWSDNDVLLVACLTLLVRSGNFARIEEANGTELTLDHVAHLLERVRRNYNAVPGGAPVPPTEDTGVAALNALAERLRERRQEVSTQVTLYRVIHGALMHKIENVAGPAGKAVGSRIRAVVRRLSEELPVSGYSLERLGDALAGSPEWLAGPYGGFCTGFEALIHRTVAASTDAFAADFAMSRGIRSLPALIRALREQDWATITSWEIAHYYCCVVPNASAERHFDGSRARLADMAWAMSSRMQYNSWHFIAGNLPKEPVVVARDHFVPPIIPDLAYYSDQHHHGHVTAKVRFSIRSPYAADILGRRFNGFVDLRLLRCDGHPFDEQDLLAARQVSAFIGRATGLVADLVAAGTDVEVASFDSRWHWDTIVGTDRVGGA